MTPTDILTGLAAILALLGIALLSVVIISMIQRIMSRLQLQLPKKVMEKKQKRRTERMDRQAKEGVTFENAITPSPLCVPARTSIMTGKYPHSTGCRRNETLLPENVFEAIMSSSCVLIISIFKSTSALFSDLVLIAAPPNTITPKGLADVDTLEFIEFLSITGLMM